MVVPSAETDFVGDFRRKKPIIYKTPIIYTNIWIANMPRQLPCGLQNARESLVPICCLDYVFLQHKESPTGVTGHV